MVEFASIAVGCLALVVGSFVTLAIIVFGPRFGDRGATSLGFPLVVLLVLTCAGIAHWLAASAPAGRAIAQAALAIERIARIVLGFAWVWAGHRLLRFCGIVDLRQKLTPYFALSGAAALAIYGLSLFVPVGRRLEAAIDIEVAVSLVYAASNAVITSWKTPITLPSARAAVALAGISMVIYPLVSLADIFDFSYPGMTPGLPIWVQTQPLYYAVVVAVLVPFVNRRLIAVASSTVEKIDLSKYNLTDRELETVSRLLAGESYKDIAYALGVSVATVKTHVNKAYVKIGVKSRSELQATHVLR